MVHRWHVRAVLRVILNVDQPLFLELIKHLAPRKRLEEHEFGILGIELDGEIDGVADAVLGVPGQAQNEKAPRLEADVLRNTDRFAHLVLGDALLHEFQHTVIAALDPETDVAQADLLQCREDLLIDHVGTEAIGDFEVQLIRLLFQQGAELAHELPVGRDDIVQEVNFFDAVVVDEPPDLADDVLRGAKTGAAPEDVLRLAVGARPRTAAGDHDRRCGQHGGVGRRVVGQTFDEVDGRVREFIQVRDQLARPAGSNGAVRRSVHQSLDAGKIRRMGHDGVNQLDDRQLRLADDDEIQGWFPRAGDRVDRRVNPTQDRRNIRTSGFCGGGDLQRVRVCRRYRSQTENVEPIVFKSLQHPLEIHTVRIHIDDFARVTGALEHGGHPHDPERRVGRFDVDAVHVELRRNDEQHAARGARACE